MKKKILFIASHLSTGGMPQYLFKQIESIVNDVDVYCIEFENVTGGVLVVQRNKISNILGDKLITLGEDKNQLFSVLDTIQPDIIHLQEIPELFLPNHITDKLYRSDREYIIIETSHDSAFNVVNKQYFPDKFLMVSNYQKEKYKIFDIPCYVVEYPIENKTRTKTREQALMELGLDPNLKHVINVGLFTPRKNQAEILEYARLLQYYPIQFHFIGNQADNFKHYWEPLMQSFPSNCKWWNEQSDVDKFYEAADLFLFTSKGNSSDMETMPLVVREALSWKVPSMIYNLPVYMGYFDKYETIEYLQDDLSKNAYRIAEKLMSSVSQSKPVQLQEKDCIVIITYPNTKSITDTTKKCILHAKQFNLPIILTSHYPIPTELQELVDYCIFDKNNIWTTHTHYNSAWFDCENFYSHINLSGEKNNMYHGPAVHTCYYDAISLAKNLGFTHAHCWNYDVWINDLTLIDSIKSHMKEYNFVTNRYMAEEGECLATILFSTNTEFFTKHFPKINYEDEYSSWMKNVGSESNGLENMYFHTLKNNLHQVYSWTDTELTNLEEKNQMNMCSMVEYCTILPIENNDTHGMIWFSSNNNIDNRILKLYVNNNLITSSNITHKHTHYVPIVLNETKTVKFEIMDPVQNVVTYNKTIFVDSNNIKSNGIFKYKNS